MSGCGSGSEPTGGATDDLTVSFRELAWELGLLCHGLADTHVSTLQAVSTVVRLPADPAQVVTLRRVCAAVADWFGLDHQVCRAGDVWAVRFSQFPAPAPARGVVPAPSGLRAHLTHLSEAARRSAGAHLRPQLHTA